MGGGTLGTIFGDIPSRRTRPPCVALAAGILLGVAACASTGSVEDILAQPCAHTRVEEKKIGVVLLHGKQGHPQFLASIALRWALEGAGYLVEAPHMPWGAGRIYDRDYEGAMAEIDEAVAALRQRGARSIVAVGHSLGANGAIGYAARRADVTAIVAVAPGHTPERASPLAQRVLPDVRKARALVASGQGNVRGAYADGNIGWITVYTTPSIYLSYLDPEGPASIRANAAGIKPGVAVLWIEASREAYDVLGPGYAYDRIPLHPKSRFVYVAADHMGAPHAAAPAIVAWLNCL